MKILILHRTSKDETGKFVKRLKENLEKEKNNVEIISRNEDLNLTSLTSSMDSLKNFVIKKNQKENYDLIFTQDWSIAFPLLFPSKILFEKHFCFFHDLEEKGAQSKIMQKITGNLLGNHLVVKTKKLKDKFSKSTISEGGLEVLGLVRDMLK